jgi:hypothetical protein
MVFSCPEDAHWNAERQTVESSASSSASTKAWSGSHGVCSNAYSPSGPPPRGASRRTTSSEPGSRVSPSGSCAAGV